MRKLLLWFQGMLFALTGLWPLLHMPSFLAVTGPKKEVWLVEVAGILILAIGTTLLASVIQGVREKSVGLLGFFSAMGLGAMDVRYATREVILDVYLLDAAAEFLIALAWLWLFWQSGREKEIK